MTEPLLVQSAALAGGLSALGMAAGSRWHTARTAGFALLGIVLALATATLWVRADAAGRAPFKTLYESLVLGAACAALVGLLVARMPGSGAMAFIAAAGACAALVYAAIRPELEISRLPPALQSAWFVPHVVTYFLAYAALLAATGGAAALLVWGRFPEERVHGLVRIGFALLTAGLAMGAVWAKYAWGRPWSWDPKESWALVTWLIYLAYVHLHSVAGWRGRRTAWFLIAGLVAVLFTYLGMNLLPATDKSLHVYQ